MGTDVCCATFTFTGGSAECVSADSMCGAGGIFTGMVELCHDAADCTDSSHMCCPIMMGGFSAAYCATMCMTGFP